MRFSKEKNRQLTTIRFVKRIQNDVVQDDVMRDAKLKISSVTQELRDGNATGP